MARRNSINSQAAIERLKEILQPGDTVYTIVKHVATSGMSRSIDCYALKCDGGKVQKHWLSRSVASAVGFCFDDKREAVRVGGCGMDMGYHVIHELSHVLGIELNQEWL